MCCDLVGSVGSWQHWLWHISRKRNEFLLFWESFNCSLTWNHWTDSSGFSAKCTSPNEHFNQIEIWKCHMCEFTSATDFPRLHHINEIRARVSKEQVLNNMMHVHKLAGQRTIRFEFASKVVMYCNSLVSGSQTWRWLRIHHTCIEFAWWSLWLWLRTRKHDPVDMYIDANGYWLVLRTSITSSIKVEKTNACSSWLLKWWQNKLNSVISQVHFVKY